MTPLVVLVVVLVAATVAGVVGWLWWRGDGTLRPGSGEQVLPADVRLPEGSFGGAATLLLLTSQQDDRSTAVRSHLARLAQAHPGTALAEVDLTRHGDLAGRYAVTRTPSVLVLDGDGRLRARVKGAGDAAVLARALDAALDPRD